MRKQLGKILAAVLALSFALSFAGCGNKSITIAIPNDTTNEARALLLLEANGVIKLRSGAGIEATVADIVENPHNIQFFEVEAAQLPNVLPDMDYAIINGNYAIPAGLRPADALFVEGSASPYANILCVKEGNENEPKIQALKAAMQSDEVIRYIKKNYPDGAVVPTIDNPTDGFDPEIEYGALAGTEITIAATPSPHAEILTYVVADLLAMKDITLKVIEYTDYVQPNMVVESGEVDANYFQHVPYLDDFNAKQGTHLFSVAPVHCEPMGMFGGKQKTIDALK